MPDSKLKMAMDDTADETVIAGLRQDVTDAEGMRDKYKAMLDTANALSLMGILAEGLTGQGDTRLEGELADLRQKEADDEVAEAAKMKERDG